MQSFGHSLWGWISHKTEEKKCGIFQIYRRDTVANMIKMIIALINAKNIEKHNPESETTEVLIYFKTVSSIQSISLKQFMFLYWMNALNGGTKNLT